MLGRDHALLGAAAYLAGAPSIARLAGLPMSPAELAVGTCVAAGFALLPDIDEPHSTLSRKLGPVTGAVSVAAKTVSGGHRHGTHSLLFVALATWGAYLSLAWNPTVPHLGHVPAAAMTVVAVAMLLVLRIILPLWIGRKGLVALVLVVAAAVFWVAHAKVLRYWLPWSVAAGVAMHLVGDVLTAEGVPLFWPLPGRVAVPLVGHTQSFRETVLGLSLSLAIVVLGYFELVRPILAR